MFRKRRRGAADGNDNDAELADADPGAAEPDDDDLVDDEFDEDDFDEDQDFGDDEDEDGAGGDFRDEDSGSEDSGSDDAAGARPARSARSARSARHARPRAEHHDLGDPATWTRLRDSSAAAAPSGQPGGPWDGASDYPDVPRMDFGSLLVPMRDGTDIQVNLDEAAGMWIAVVRQDSALQLQAFAAPKSSGLWDDVRSELADEVARAGGQSQEAVGPFGPELRARMAPPGAPEQLLRFMGVDGPRWFLRGMITGPASASPESAAELESIFADVVVVRGDHPAPPRAGLEIRLPDEARQALEQQAEAEAAQGGSRFAGEGMPNPFERGPEITETR